MQAELKITKGHNVGKKALLQSEESLTLGRSVSAEFQVVDHAVSRRHCTVTVTGQGAQLTDLGSANGTYLNGRRITQAPLTSGDEIRLGSTFLSIALEAGAAAMPACTKCGRVLTAPEADAAASAAASGGPILCASCRPPAKQAPIIGGYRVLKILGRGAMGTVYRAESLDGSATVAIKALALDKTQNEKCVKRFLREANLEASLQHPNIVQVYDIIEAMGTYCLVMEFVEGIACNDLIKQKGKVEVPVAARITREIASALQYAFEKKIIHRDIKPHNVLVARDGTAKLVDFGIAKNMEQAGMSRITAPGQQLGTLSYMSPEQLRNALSADQRSDIYSLGASLYHMLAGDPPVAGRDFEAIVIAILDQKPRPIREINSAVPVELARVIEKSLEKEPQDRYQVPGELARDLQALGF